MNAKKRGASINVNELTGNLKTGEQCHRQLLPLHDDLLSSQHVRRLQMVGIHVRPPDERHTRRTTFLPPIRSIPTARPVQSSANA